MSTLRWCASTRSRWCCTRTRGLRHRCSRDKLRGAAMNTSAVEPPTCSANVFCGIEPKAGRHFTKVTPTRSSPESADLLLEMAVRYSAADTILLVMDDLSTHTRKALVGRCGEEVARGCGSGLRSITRPNTGTGSIRPRSRSASSPASVGKRRIGDITSLRSQARAWNQRVNRDKTTIRWKFTRKQARRKLNYTITRSRY